jgi:hypothetical protein
MLNKMTELKAVYDAQGLVLSAFTDSLGEMQENCYVARVLFRLDQKMHAMEPSFSPMPIESYKKSLNEMVFGEEK